MAGAGALGGPESRGGEIRVRPPQVERSLGRLVFSQLEARPPGGSPVWGGVGLPQLQQPDRAAGAGGGAPSPSPVGSIAGSRASAPGAQRPRAQLGRASRQLGLPPPPISASAQAFRSEKVGPGLQELKCSLAFHCAIPVSAGNAPGPRSSAGWISAIREPNLSPRPGPGPRGPTQRSAFGATLPPAGQAWRGGPGMGALRSVLLRSPEEPSNAGPGGVWSCPQNLLDARPRGTWKRGGQSAPCSGPAYEISASRARSQDQNSSGPKGLATGKAGAHIPENCDLWASGARASQWIWGFDGWLGPRQRRLWYGWCLASDCVSAQGRSLVPSLPDL